MIKVCLFQNTLAPYRITLFNKIAADDNINFELVLLSKGEPSRAFYDEANFSQVKFKINQLSGISFQISYERQVNINFSIIRYLLIEKPDVIVCAGFSIATIFSFLYSKLMKKGYIIWNEGTKDTEIGLSTFRIYQRKLLARNAAAFVTAGKLSHEYLSGLVNGLRIPDFVSYNTIENEKFKKNVSSFRKSIQRQNLIFRFLFCGQFVNRKGVWKLIEVFEYLSESITKCELLMIGDGPEKKKIKNYLSEKSIKNIEVFDFVQPEGIFEYYAQADAFILLSRKDPNPLVIFEALASGLPIICSKYAGNYPEFVQDGKNGFTVDPFNQNDIINKINQLVNHVNIKKFSDYSLSLNSKVSYTKSANGFLDAINYVYQRNGKKK